MRKNIGQRFVLSMLAILLAVMLAVPAFAADWKQTYERFAAMAGETLVTGDVVCIAAADGKAYKADADNSSRRPAVGIVGKGGATSATIEVVTRGIVTGQTPASPGARVFLSTTAGGKTVTAPNNAQVLGWVIPAASGGASSTVYYINVQLPNTPSAGY